MTVILDGTTLWTVNSVSTNNQGNGTVYITGTNKDKNESLSLAISGFIKGKKSYSIDYRGTGGNIYGNTGTYSQGSNLYDARSGYINVTSVVNNAITGSFGLTTAKGGITGSFVAAEK